ncbi:ABC transporter [Streptomyces sp. NA04227]|uniref:ABC transporter n=1 Tax=Streptomyces sp. NA04227 TaxID=2742136 RepID=UPI001592A8CD|nr:ABC transporter [Streptomyces sp. NA04227]QKW11234.1 ABC transporter [Streptomyces sp. NA04227]
MPALLRYHGALLIRSQRLIAPVLCYAAVLAIGVRSGGPILDSLGWTAAALLPVAAWTVRICVTNEPAAARSCLAAPAGPWRAHLGAVLTAALASSALGTVAAVVVSLLSKSASTNGKIPVDRWPATAAGLLAVLLCALLGTAVGALGTWPLTRSTGRSVTALTGGAVLALVTSGSPARTAVTGLVTGSRDAEVIVPVLPFLLAVLAAATATTLACWASSRR